MKLLNKIKGVLCLIPMGSLLLLLAYSWLHTSWKEVLVVGAFFSVLVLFLFLALKGIGYLFDEEKN